MAVAIQHLSGDDSQAPDIADATKVRSPMLLREFKWKKEVLESSEPVLVDFWASWCGPCRMMEPAIESLARDFKVCKVNVDVNQPLAARYKISSIPTLLIFKNGKVIKQHIGVVSEAALRAEMEALRGH